MRKPMTRGRLEVIKGELEYVRRHGRPIVLAAELLTEVEQLTAQTCETCKFADVPITDRAIHVGTRRCRLLDDARVPLTINDEPFGCRGHQLKVDHRLADTAGGE